MAPIGGPGEPQQHAASTVASALTPGSGSARQGAPIGISGDAATATPAAAAPMAAATPTLISPAAISCRRVRPSAASAGVSGKLVASNRVAAWPNASGEVPGRNFTYAPVAPAASSMLHQHRST